MNDDTDFEKKLRALTSALRRPDPTPEWKTDILARARREARGERHARITPPRPLLFVWAAAWAAIVLMSIATPRNSDRTSSSNSTGGIAARDDSAAAINTSLETLVAFHRQDHFNNDLP